MSVNDLNNKKKSTQRGVLFDYKDTFIDEIINHVPRVRN